MRVKVDCSGAEIDDQALQSVSNLLYRQKGSVEGVTLGDDFGIEIHNLVFKVFRLISKLLKNTIQSAKSFVRWMVAA